MRGSVSSDWWATFVVGLAGGNMTDDTAAVAGLPRPDSIDMWPYLSGAVPASPRTEIWLGPPLHGDDILPYPRTSGGDSAYIMGSFKLILNNVSQASWEGPQYPNATRWDTWLTVESCTIPGQKPGCLFDIFEDPEERHDLALTMPAKVAEIKARMEALEPTVYDPVRRSILPVRRLMPFSCGPAACPPKTDAFLLRSCRVSIHLLRTARFHLLASAMQSHGSNERGVLTTVLGGAAGPGGCRLGRGLCDGREV